jgi:hypothetical protein
MALSIFCMRFFRAPRGKTAYEQKSSTALPKAKKADRVSPVIDIYMQEP